MQTSYLNLILTALLSGLLLFTGCENPVPSQALTKAKLMLSKAEAVDAPVYAETEYKKANTLLTDAIEIADNEDKVEEAIKKAEESYKQAEIAYKKAVKERAKILIKELKEKDQQMQDKNIPALFPDKYQVFTKELADGETLFTDKQYIKSYEKLLQAETKAEELFADLDSLITRNLDALDKADLAIKDARKKGAEKHAPTSLNKAVSLLREAENLKDELKHYQSIDKAEAAEKAADLALKTTRAALYEEEKAAALSLLQEAEKYYQKAKKFAAQNEKNDKIQKTFAAVEENYEKAKDHYNNDNFDLANQFSRETIRLAKLLLNTQTAKTYTVRYIPKRRDCLWRIAEYDFIYDDPYKWPLIWKANLDKIEDPDLIFPEQTFRIPAASE
ncbi:MAG TPA: hypothetical protein VKS21_01445 [Spirochaetota bacterium]|nr:hypothetical protein [Spirochaetota bacterium]